MWLGEWRGSALSSVPRARCSIMMPVRWMLQHRTATVLITLMILFLVVLIVLIIAGIWFWGLLEEYVKPKNPTGRKDVVQAFTLIVAGVVGLLGGIVSIASLLQQRALEEKRAQEDAKQSYFEEMGNLLTDENLIDTDREDIRQLAQAQTLTILERLAGERKRAVIGFLYGAGLIYRDKAVVGLSGANLRNAKLRGANLAKADLAKANLRGADLREAILRGADLHGADLGGADIRPNADLREADLRGADLTNAAVTQEQLAVARTS
jgi:flagellar basal body-associated protein FliL